MAVLLIKRVDDFFFNEYAEDEVHKSHFQFNFFHVNNQSTLKIAEDKMKSKTHEGEKQFSI